MTMCPEAWERAEEDDGAFWTRVTRNLTPQPFAEDPADDLDVDSQMRTEPCAECGSTVACAYDAQGRPLIHAVEADDE